ncbi:MAG TPA: ABC transporter substrate-binding protein, partial [Acidobacteriota bacterium]|nr:ABC transporter substrate-binding protein [Acidobacteriota bacterium]
NEILEIIGARNIFAERKDAYFMATAESIAARDPDVIISLWRSAVDYQKAENWRALRAVKENRILDLKSMDWNLITRQSPRLIEGMRQLQQLLTAKAAKRAKIR